MAGPVSACVTSLALAARLALAPADAAARAAAPVDGGLAHITADDVTLEARSKVLSLHGHVDVQAEPFHLTADDLRVTRTPRGLVVEGDGRVAFCPCLGEPVALDFKGATVAPPGDLFLTQPRIEAGGVPVFWLPWFWLRSSGRVGLLPPDVAYRGQDGFFLGDGVHIPWNRGDTQAGLDLRAGAYVNGGAAVEGTLTTPTSVTTLRWDDLGTSGLTVDARGSTASESDENGRRGTTLSWDADLLRGGRAVVSTTDLDAASRVYDRAAAESSWRDGGWTLAAGVWAENVRGSGLSEIDASGPVVRARGSGALGGVGTYEATAEGGTVSGAGLTALSYGRGDTALLFATRWGPIGASAVLRGAADVGSVSLDEGYDAAGSARLRLALPLERSFDVRDPSENDAWRHRVEPEVEAGAIVEQGDGLVGDVPAPGGVRGAAWLADGGVRTSLGRWGAREGLEVGGDVGGVGGIANDEQPTALVARWRAAGSGQRFGLGAEGADVAGPAGGWGHAVAARARVGEVRSWSLALTVAGRAGVDPVVARALTDAPLASSAGFLATSGWTSAARVTVPVTHLLLARGGVDGDLSAERLVGGHGSLEIHDKCQCVAVRLSAADRIGRQGVDVWLSVDLH